MIHRVETLPPEVIVQIIKRPDVPLAVKQIVVRMMPDDQLSPLADMFTTIWQEQLKALRALDSQSPRS